MERIELELGQRKEKDSLRAFLEACREEAGEDGHFKLASINLRIPEWVDPLRLLDSIDEAEAAHAYIEEPDLQQVVAGAEAVVEKSFSGPTRFQDVRRFAEEILEHTVAVGDLSADLSGPLFFCGFGFFDAEGTSRDFPPAYVFVAHWQVLQAEGYALAVANLRVDADANVDHLTERVWAAHEKLVSFSANEKTVGAAQVVQEKEVGGEDQYPAAVRKALRQIDKGVYEKVVLARAVDLELDAACRPLQILAGMRKRFGACHLFSYQRGDGGSWIGATPEKLVELRKGSLRTEAIAGSAPRDSHSATDDELGNRLLKSEKDIREHRHVVDSLLRRLSRLGHLPEIATEPILLKLPNVQHLVTPIECAAIPRQHLLEIAEELHPTPATGGTPRQVALADIRQFEAFDREWYAGLFGFFSPSGEGALMVGIRSARIQGNQARLFAGAGIVAGSDPQLEAAETRMKMAALRDAIFQNSPS